MKTTKPATRQTAKKPRTTPPAAKQGTGRSRAAKAAGRPVMADSGRCAVGDAPAVAPLSLGPDGMRLESIESQADQPNASAYDSSWSALMPDGYRIAGPFPPVPSVSDHLARVSDRLASVSATLASARAAWSEYRALTTGEWHPDRATALRNELSALLGDDQ